MRVYIVYGLSLLFGWLPSFVAIAQFERLSIEQGLSQNTIMSIIQDSQGFLWVGTQDGLNRYDGHEFKVYQSDPKQPNTLSDDYILSLYQDNSGYIWVGTQHGGLNRFDPVSESFISFEYDANNKNSLSSNHIIRITPDSQGSLWLSTWGGGVTRFWPKAGKFERYNHRPGDLNSLPHRIANDVVEDANNNIWVATYGGGLAKFSVEINGFIQYRHEPGNNNSISSNLLWKLHADKNGTLWLATEGQGLDNFNPATGQVTRYVHDAQNPNSLSNNHVRTVVEDAQSNLWVGTFGGLNRLSKNRNEFERFEHDLTDSKSISGPVIQEIYQSRDGIIWIGTFTDALNKYNSRHAQFGHIKRDGNNPDSLRSNGIRAITRDKKGTLWIGTDGGGLHQYDAQKDIYYAYQHDENDPLSIGSNRTWGIVEDHEGVLWVATFANGLSKMDRLTNTFKNYHAQPGTAGALQNHLVMSLLQDSKNNLWVGTYGGLYRYRPKTDDFEAFLHDPQNPNSISDDAILSIMEDSKGHLWLGTYGGGLNRYSPKTGVFNHFMHDPDDPQSISNNSPMATYEDPNGIIWIATYGGGLNKLNPNTGKFTQFSTAHGLRNSSTYSALPDEQGNLWVSTNDGLSMFDITTERFVNYSTKDGTQSQEFNSGAYFKSPDGELFFGGINGINRFFAKNITKPSHDMPVILTQMQLFNETIDQNSRNIEDKIYLSKSLNFTEQLTLDYRDSLFSFEFAALNFDAPKRHRFAYMLENYDKKWIFTDHKIRRATYTNIASGKYTLKVKARAADGDWSSAVAKLDIIITPAPWRTWWAYTGYLLLMAAIVGSFVWQRYQKYVEVSQAKDALQQLNQELEIRVQNRTAKLTEAFNQLKQTQAQLVESEKLAGLGSLVVGVAHELNTPLGIATTAHSHVEHIVGTLCDQKNKNTLTKKGIDRFETDSIEGLSLLGKNLLRCTALVQQFKALAADNRGVDCRQFQLLSVLSNIKQTVAQSLVERNITFKILCDESTTMHSHPQALEKILSQLIQNSLTHGFEDQRKSEVDWYILIEAKQADTNIILQYSDNGVGLEAEPLSQIFDPFYTTKRGTDCTGLGMLTVYNIILHQLGGTVSCASEPKQGLTVTMTMPAKFD